MFEFPNPEGESAAKYRTLFFIALFALLGITYYEIINYNNSKTEIVFNTVETESQLFVDVSGAVGRPGVYELTSESRLGEVLALAGGITPKANASWVTKTLNLSEKVVDAQKIYIPYEWEGEVSEFKILDLSENNNPSSSLININTGTHEQLTKIPGIGEVYANKIIENRPYTQIEDLSSRKVLSNTLVGKVKDFVTL